MAAIINVNGRITDAREAVVPVLDHGFLYGEGIYEVVRTYGRRPFLFDRHLQRLRRSAAMISLPVPFTDTEVESRINETIAAYDAARPGLPPDEVYVRLIVTRGVGEISYDPAGCPAPTVVVIVKTLVPLPASVYEDGVRVAIVSVVRNHPGSINPLIKSNNLLNNALAAQEAYRRGAFDAVLRNYRGEISECSIANLFIVRHGEVLTPPVDAGLLVGITRGFVLELGCEGHVPIRETVLHDEDLFGADEAFLTSSTQEIVPIVQVDDRPIGNGKPGPTTRRLHGLYRQRVEEMTNQPV